MRSISLLALIAVALTNYAKGDVTITATDAGGGKLRIGYQATGTTAPVTFALDIQLSNGATFSSVTPMTGNFPFYPSRFRDYINPNNPNWGNPNYLPLASWADPDALAGLGTSGVTIEMSAMLYPYMAVNSDFDLNSDDIIDLTDSSIFSNEWLTPGGMADLDNSGSVDFFDYAVFLDGHFDPVPALSGDLLFLQLNGNGAEITTANISLNFIRGGIVLEDATKGNAILPNQITVIVPEPVTLILLGLGAAMLRKKARN